MSEWEEFKGFLKSATAPLRRGVMFLMGSENKAGSPALENQRVLHEICHGVALQGPDSPAPLQLQRNNLLRLFLTVHVKYLH